MAKQNPPCQIYLITPPVITDIDAFAGNLEAALAAAPVACLQIRLKGLEDLALIQAADVIVPIAHRYGTDVLVNDRPDLVEACRADGVHIGQKDMDYYSSREMLGEDAIIGVTCHNSRELAFQAAMSGADYVAFGAFFETQTKEPKFPAELEILEWWSEAVEIPSVAIGGINTGNAKAVIEAGADFIALSSGVWNHKDGPAAAVSQLSELCASHSPG